MVITASKLEQIEDLKAVLKELDNTLGAYYNAVDALNAVGIIYSSPTAHNMVSPMFDYDINILMHRMDIAVMYSIKQRLELKIMELGGTL